MIVLFTDFGWGGPYAGQVRAVLAQAAPGVPVIDLMHDAPAFAPQPAAYLLAALAREFPEGTVFLAVVDPGVGGTRAVIAVSAAGRWFVGPDNGLLGIAARHTGGARVWEVDWRPARLSASFHGRDLFAPIAARIGRGAAPAGRERTPGPGLLGPAADWPDDLPQVIYCDRFGNATTGLRATALPPDAAIGLGDRRLAHARTFSEVPTGTPFWYENANGLVEIAVNRGSAAEDLDLAVGSGIVVLPRAG